MLREIYREGVNGVDDASSKNVHSGHRSRMREKLEQNGSESMSSQDMLEMLLYQCLPRIDTNKLAAELLKRFDTFSGVINAPVKELVKVEGVGMSTAKFLHQLPQFMRFYMEDMTNATKRVFSSETAFELIRGKFLGRRNEIIVLMILNSRGQVIYNNVVSEGSVAMVPVYIKKVIELCIEYDADTVFIAHNHPSGNPAPSKGDIVATKELQLALESVYITLSDHLIFTDTDYTSMKKSGWLEDIAKASASFKQAQLNDALIAEKKL